MKLPTRSLPFFLVVAAAALAVRVAFFVGYYDARQPPFKDRVIYRSTAQSLIDGDGYTYQGRPTAFYPPLYPIVLTPFAATDTLHGVGPSLLGLTFSSATAGLLALLTRRRYGNRAGWVAMGLSATLPSAAYWAPSVLSDTLGVLCLCGGVFVLLGPPPLPWTRSVMGGLCLAAALLTRAAMVFPVAGLLGWMLLRRDRRRRLRTGLVVGATIAASLMPWTVRNATQLGRPYPISSSSGQNAWISVHWESRRQITPPYPAALETEAATDAAISAAARDHLRREPEAYLRGLYRKPALMWPLHVSGYSLARTSVETWVTMLGALGLLGFVRIREVRLGEAWWAVMSVAITLGAALTYVDGDLRYRLPLMVPVIPPAAATLSVFLDRFSGRRTSC